MPDGSILFIPPNNSRGRASSLARITDEETEAQGNEGSVPGRTEKKTPNGDLDLWGLGSISPAILLTNPTPAPSGAQELIHGSMCANGHVKPQPCSHPCAPATQERGRSFPGSSASCDRLRRTPHAPTRGPLNTPDAGSICSCTRRPSEGTATCSRFHALAGIRGSSP